MEPACRLADRHYKVPVLSTTSASRPSVSDITTAARCERPKVALLFLNPRDEHNITDATNTKRLIYCFLFGHNDLSHTLHITTRHTAQSYVQLCLVKQNIHHTYTHTQKAFHNHSCNVKLDHRFASCTNFPYY